MTELKQFCQQLKQRIAAAQSEPRWTAEAAARYMAEFAPRRQRFAAIAQHLVATVIEPRVAAVAEQFANATADRNAHADRSVWWFGYCERFPVTARLEFAIGHDEKIDQISVKYDLDLMPAFLKYDAHDRLAMPMDAVDDEVAMQWVEAKLFDFLDAYLAVDRGPDDFEDEAVSDPVCGMRMSRSSVAATSEYKGHPYFFCSDACRKQFDVAPDQYVVVQL